MGWEWRQAVIDDMTADTETETSSWRLQQLLRRLSKRSATLPDGSKTAKTGSTKDAPLPGKRDVNANPCYPFPFIATLFCLAVVGAWMLLDELLVKKQHWGTTEALWVLGALAVPTVLRGVYLVALYTRCRMRDEGRPGSIAEARARLFYWLALRFQALGEAHECGLAVYRNRLNGKREKTT